MNPCPDCGSPDERIVCYYKSPAPDSGFDKPCECRWITASQRKHDRRRDRLIIAAFLMPLVAVIGIAWLIV